MSPRALKIALTVSVTLNVFVIGAVVGGLIVGGRALREDGEARAPVFALVRSLDEPDQERVRGALREAALSSRSDFEAARAARLEAVELASAEPFDRSAVDAALERSHRAEGVGRRRLESTLLDVMADLEPAERQTLAPALSRRGPERGRHGGARRPRDRP